MTVHERIKKALDPLGLPVVHGVHLGEADTYFTFNVSTAPADFADDEPAHELCLVQVHLFCPHSNDSVELLKNAKKRLRAEGFTWPSNTDAGAGGRESSHVGQHHVLECEDTEGVD